jgi:acyl carrier protein
VFFVAAIEDWLGLELASDTAMEHPTIARLTRFVADQREIQSRAAPTRR